jgi:hypothetical protein
MPLQHQPGADDVDANIMTSRTLYRPAGVKLDEDKPRLDPTATDKRVKSCQRRLSILLAADAPASVITRARAKLAEARDAVLEKIALKRSRERAKTLAAQRETVRLQSEREVLARLDQNLMPVLTLNFGPLQIVVTPEKSTDHTLRGFAWGDYHRAAAIIATQATRVAGLARHATAKMEVLPVDVPHLKRELEDVMRRSLAAGLASIEVID